MEQNLAAQLSLHFEAYLDELTTSDGGCTATMPPKVGEFLVQMHHHIVACKVPAIVRAPSCMHGDNCEQDQKQLWSHQSCIQRIPSHHGRTEPSADESCTLVAEHILDSPRKSFEHAYFQFCGHSHREPTGELYASSSSFTGFGLK